MSSPPMRQARRSSSILPDSGSRSRRASGAGSSIPVPNTGLRANRLANTQPTYDFITGTSAHAPAQPLQRSFRQSQAVKPDAGNEDLRAQIKTLQYELDSSKQERELANLRHDKELRDAQLKADEVFQEARAEESKKLVPVHKYEALRRELRDSQDQALNQQNALEKKLRNAQEECRSAKEEAEELQSEVSSLGRQQRHQLQEIESKHATLQKTLEDLRTDLENKSSSLKITQDRLSQRETDAGQLESEILRLKAQTGDADTLAVIKRELSEQMTHIRTLESTNREQNAELKHFRRIHKAVEVVEEEKSVLKSRLGVMADLERQLGEAHLQRQILEDEKRSWTSYLQSEGGTGKVEFDSPEDMARALVKQRLENASIVERMGAVQPELLEKDEIIRSLEQEQSSLRSEVEKLKVNGGGGNSNEGRIKKRLETQLGFAKKEIENLRELFQTYDNEQQTYHSENQFDSLKSQRITDLEGLIDNQRRELMSLTSTLDAQPAPAPPQTPLKRAREDDSDDRLGQLSRKTRKLQDTLTSLQNTHALLQTEHAATKTQLISLQASSKTRILSLRSNPTANAETLKQSTLTTLRQENKDLLAQLESRPPGGVVQSVPLATLNSLRTECAALEQTVAEKEKRMLRLKQIWASKALEFREAVFSLLGWKMDFRPGGKFALSLQAQQQTEEEEEGSPRGDDDGATEQEPECLIFDGEMGTMKVAGGMESVFGGEVRPLVREWVEGRGDIPAFMASVLLMKKGGWGRQRR